MALTIRGLREADLDAADAIAVAAYRSPASRHAELLRYLRLQPDGWLLAELDALPVGVVGAIDYGPFASIGMMAVHPDLQRRGIARALLEGMLAWLDARGCPLSILDASDAGAPLYPRYGFEERGWTRQFQYGGAVRGASADAVTVPREDELPALAAFDAPIFGASRAAVLTSYYRDHPHRVLAARDRHGTILGYIIARPAHIGPWAATSTPVAEMLLSAALALPYESPPVVNAPPGNPATEALLQRAGFTVQRSLLHMHRGAAALPGRRDLLYAEASFALG